MGEISTGVGDNLGISRAVSSFLHLAFSRLYASLTPNTRKHVPPVKLLWQEIDFFVLRGRFPKNDSEERRRKERKERKERREEKRREATHDGEAGPGGGLVQRAEAV